MSFDHPNEPGKWVLLARTGQVALWRRDRSDPYPVSLFYLIAPPRQAEVVYNEEAAHLRFAQLAPDAASSDAIRVAGKSKQPAPE